MSFSLILNDRCDNTRFCQCIACSTYQTRQTKNILVHELEYGGAKDIIKNMIKNTIKSELTESESVKQTLNTITQNNLYNNVDNILKNDIRVNKAVESAVQESTTFFIKKNGELQRELDQVVNNSKADIKRCVNSAIDANFLDRQIVGNLENKFSTQYSNYCAKIIEQNENVIYDVRNRQKDLNSIEANLYELRDNYRKLEKVVADNESNRYKYGLTNIFFGGVIGAGIALFFKK